MIVLPETDIEAARRKLESLRESVANMLIMTTKRSEKIRATISAGLASFPEDGENPAQLFASADEKLFQAKKEGRNRVVAGERVVSS